ncbi:DUF4254 domain-containing protein [Legionella septentrionalis]|uniref:DUF4254 domain-containing protein n=1 Tax=Legionella septentrionalis TaxID=2498109 RepID=A0A3S0V6I6_9GAMM|nr:DUF4254 domain-containing protein [Legionella septentrionalis]RUQ91080.1 DUF4254 domain-containing protein [Legionella septentrionalis]RUR02851.1 DUF4254 domain-containing protein [Legionella septentrionalis]
MKPETFVPEITKLQQDSIINWKKDNIQFKQEGFLRLVEENHAFNYQLWHAEDRARRDDQGYEFVYRAKREIDQYNQQRNNRMEEMDTWLFKLLQPAQAGICPVHSETPGMMIDRLSILALKAYHMNAQTQRQDVDETHRQTCLEKLHVIHLQQQQLQGCLTELLHEILAKTRTFKIYHQFKMYNDPNLNPQLYKITE